MTYSRRKEKRARNEKHRWMTHVTEFGFASQIWGSVVNMSHTMFSSQPRGNLPERFFVVNVSNTTFFIVKRNKCSGVNVVLTVNFRSSALTNTFSVNMGRKHSIESFLCCQCLVNDVLHCQMSSSELLSTIHSAVHSVCQCRILSSSDRGHVRQTSTGHMRLGIALLGGGSNGISNTRPIRS
jgi:hypothetical protein